MAKERIHTGDRTASVDGWAPGEVMVGAFGTDKGEVVVPLSKRLDDPILLAGIETVMKRHDMAFDWDQGLGVIRRPRVEDGKGRRDRMPQEVESAKRAVALMSGVVAGDREAMEAVREASRETYPLDPGAHGPLTVAYQTDRRSLAVGQNYTVALPDGGQGPAAAARAFKKAGGTWYGGVWHVPGAGLQEAVSAAKAAMEKVDKAAATLVKLMSKLAANPPQGTEHVTLGFTPGRPVLEVSAPAAVGAELERGFGATPAGRGTWAVDLKHHAKLMKALPELENAAVGAMAAQKVADAEWAVVLAAAKDTVAALKGALPKGVSVDAWPSGIRIAFPFDEGANAAVRAIGGRFDGNAKAWVVPVGRHAELPDAVARIDAELAVRERAQAAARRRHAEERERFSQEQAAEAARKAAEVRKAEEAAGIFVFHRPGNGSGDGRVGDIEWIGDHPHRVVSVRCRYFEDPEEHDCDGWVVDGKVKRIEGPEAERLIAEEMRARGHEAADLLGERLYHVFDRFSFNDKGRIGTPCDEPSVRTVRLEHCMRETGQLFGYAEAALDRDAGTIALSFRDIYIHDSLDHRRYEGRRDWRAVAYPEADAGRLAVAFDALVRWKTDGLPLDKADRDAELKDVLAIPRGLGTLSPAPEGTRFDPPDAGGLEFDDIDGPVIESVDVDEDGGFTVGIGR